MRACGDPSRGGIWITEPFIDGYTLGYMESGDGRTDRGLRQANWSSWLVGLYGVRIRGLLPRRIDVSSAASTPLRSALMALVRAHAGQGRMTLLDVQWCKMNISRRSARLLFRARCTLPGFARHWERST